MSRNSSGWGGLYCGCKPLATSNKLPESSETTVEIHFRCVRVQSRGVLCVRDNVLATRMRSGFVRVAEMKAEPGEALDGGEQRL